MEGEGTNRCTHIAIPLVLPRFTLSTLMPERNSFRTKRFTDL
jgi:hypothetical protein